jgi:hypothetical protein
MRIPALIKAAANTNYIVKSAKEGIATDKDTVNYTQVGGQNLDSLNPVPFTSMTKWCYILWMKNPLAYSAIEIIIDFVLGDTGITYVAEDEKVQEVLDDFSRMNSISKREKQRLRDRLINGELAFFANVTKYQGKVKIGWIHPNEITDLKYNKYNQEEVVAIKLGSEDKYYEVVRWNDYEQKYVGEVFYWQSNKVGGQSRGLSELFVARDWLTQYENILDGVAKYIDGLTRIIWDIEVKNASAEQLKSKNAMMTKNPPQKQSWILHNDSEKWELNNPNVQGTSFDDIENIFKGNAIVGLREPMHFFGRGDDANRATALSMNSPFYRKIRSDQQDEIQQYSEMADFAIQCAIVAGILPQGVNTAYKCALPEPDKELIYKIAEAMGSLGNGLATLRMDDLVTIESARDVAGILIGQLGVNVEEQDFDEDSIDESTRKIYDMIKQVAKGKLPQKKVEEKPSEEMDE